MCAGKRAVDSSRGHTGRRTLSGAGKTRSRDLPSATTTGLHPRNRHHARYDFAELVQRCPELGRFVVPHPVEGDTIDFADATAVRALNRALLIHHYGLTYWDIPDGFLCPPIPGRADYLHHVADLLADGHAIPHGPSIVVLDIGVGANCIYPIIGAREYGWRFVGTDIDRAAVAWARKLVAANPSVAGNIELRLQPSPAQIFRGVVRSRETFALSICNPPFHVSREAAAAGNLRKVRNLGGGKPLQPQLNFGGRSNELWCEGGEAAFVRRMIAESAEQPHLCRWFTTLVSQQSNLPAIYRALEAARPIDMRVIERIYGQKKSRIVAWTFLER